MTALGGWVNFYVIVGSSAGALIGLQFVVMTLTANLPLTRADARPVAVLWGVAGLVGVVYVVLVARRLRSQTAYRAVFEDRLFHVYLPLTGYAKLAGSVCAACSHPRPALFVVGAAALLLLFVGIHNAWDIVTYHIFVERREDKEDERER
jgi:hypothetical protein